MKKYIFLILSLWVATASAQDTPAERIIKTITTPSPMVSVAMHRADWRNFPENSLPGIQSAIDMGADIIEIDIAMTSDSVLVLMHDRTVNRTTQGKGRVDSYTLDSLRTLRLKNGCGIVSKYPIPTLEEVLMLCKDRVVINIDKGFDYFPQVYALCEKTGTTHQILIKSSYPYEKVKPILDAQTGGRMMYMPVINVNNEEGRKTLDGYLKNMPCPAYEIVFSTLSADVAESYMKILSSGGRVWLNTLWDSLCGGWDDDDAVEDLSVYDFHIKMGVTIIQTDRPALLLRHLKNKGLHR